MSGKDSFTHFTHTCRLPLLMCKIMSNVICMMWKGVGSSSLNICQGYDLDTLPYLDICRKDALSHVVSTDKENLPLCNGV